MCSWRTRTRSEGVLGVRELGQHLTFAPASVSRPRPRELSLGLHRAVSGGLER